MGENSPPMDRLHTPPHSIEAEQAVLGGLLLDTQTWDQVGDSITADDFYRPDHKLIFDAIGELVAESKAIDVGTVSERLERRGKLADVGGLAYLSTLVRDTPTAANARAYAQIVRERALLRSLISAGNAIVSAVYSDEGLSARELVNEAGGLQVVERLNEAVALDLREVSVVLAAAHITFPPGRMRLRAGSPRPCAGSR